MRPIYNLLRVKADGTKIPLKDADGCHIVTLAPYDHASAMALTIAKSTGGPMENAVWEELK